MRRSGIWLNSFIKKQYNRCMSLPNAYALEVDGEAAKRLKIIYLEAPMDFVTLGVFLFPVV